MKIERPTRLYFDRYSQGIKREKYSYYQTLIYLINKLLKNCDGVAIKDVYDKLTKITFKNLDKKDRLDSTPVQVTTKNHTGCKL